MVNLTVLVFAYNEERRLASCLDQFTHIPCLVIDNYSTDRTCEIAKQYNIEVRKIKNPGFIECDRVMIPALQAVNTDYVLIAFTGEVIPPRLLKLYVETANSKEYDIILARRRSVTAGLHIPLEGPIHSRNSYQMRFFHKRSVSFSENQVHGIGEPVCSTDRILNVAQRHEYSFYQFRDYDSSTTEYKHAAYNDVLAKQRYQAGQRFSLFTALLATLKYFFNPYVRFGCWRFGLLGFMHSYYRAHMELTTWFRVWELQNQFTLDHVIKKNRAERQRLMLSNDIKSCEDFTA